MIQGFDTFRTQRPGSLRWPTPLFPGEFTDHFVGAGEIIRFFTDGKMGVFWSGGNPSGWIAEADWPRVRQELLALGLEKDTLPAPPSPEQESLQTCPCGFQTPYPIPVPVKSYKCHQCKALAEVFG